MGIIHLLTNGIAAKLQERFIPVMVDKLSHQLNPQGVQR